MKIFRCPERLADTFKNLVSCGRFPRVNTVRDEWVFYGTPAADERLQASKAGFFKKLKAVVLLFCILMISGIISSMPSGSQSEVLKREAYGGKVKRVGMDVKASFKSDAIERQVEIAVLPAELSPSEEALRLAGSIEYLRKAILGSNESFSSITEDLNLVNFDEENGVVISWQSENPLYVSDTGEIRFLSLKKTERVVLTADLSIGKSQRLHSFVVFINPSLKADYTDDLNRAVASQLEALNGETEGDRLFLPESDEEGVSFEWTSGRQPAPLFLVPLCLLTALLLYLSCVDTLRKEAKERKRAIEEELPNLSLQLVLLLNAGLVVQSAFKEILFQNENNPLPVYIILKALDSQSEQSNESFIKLFYAFSRRSGSRELIRFATLVADHQKKGSSLAEKLEREGDMLWETRLQRARARAKETETKLCLPLMLLLLVLVTISISPALLEL